MNHLVVVEEPAGDDADNRVRGDGDEHAHHAADVSGDEQHDENLQRAGLDAGGVDKGLIDEVVNQLGGQHDGQDNGGENPDVDP